MIYLELENKIVGSLLNNYSFVYDFNLEAKHFRDKNNKSIITYFLNNKDKIATMESGQAEIELQLECNIPISVTTDICTYSLEIKTQNQFNVLQDQLRKEYDKVNMLQNVRENVKRLENEEIDLEIFKNAIRGLCDDIDVCNNNTLLDTEEITNELMFLLDNTDEEVLKTKFKHLNKSLGGGLYKKQLNVISARPSIGKTALGVQLFLDLTKEHKGIFFSVESSRKTIERRIMSNLSGIPLQKIRRGELETEEIQRYTQYVGAFSNRKAIITDFTNKKNGKLAPKTIENICNYARKVKYKNGLDFIVVDHLLEIKTEKKFNDKRQQIDYILEMLRDLLSELNITVILLAQIGRTAEGRERPTLADLKESGGIEEKADNVLILYREDRKSTDLEINIAKARDGAAGKTISCGYRLINQYIYERE